MVVIHADQEQSSCRRGGACSRARERFQNRRNLCLRQVSPSHFEKGPNQVSHHVMEETIAAHAINVTLRCRSEPRGSRKFPGTTSPPLHKEEALPGSE